MMTVNPELRNTHVTDLFPADNSIHDSPYGNLINDSIGYFLALFEEEIDKMNDGCFIETADDDYLKLHGKDYNILRKTNDDTEKYRDKLKIMPLDKFNIESLYDVYDAQLLARDDDDDPIAYGSEVLKLYSDNHYMSDKYYLYATDDVKEELDKKYIMKNVIDYFEWSSYD